MSSDESKTAVCGSFLMICMTGHDWCNKINIVRCHTKYQDVIMLQNVSDINIKIGFCKMLEDHSIIIYIFLQSHRNLLFHVAIGASLIMIFYTCKCKFFCKFLFDLAWLQHDSLCSQSKIHNSHANGTAGF